MLVPRKDEMTEDILFLLLPFVCEHGYTHGQRCLLEISSLLHPGFLGGQTQVIEVA